MAKELNGYDFTADVRASLAAARKAAIELQHEYVGTEHVLLGLIRIEKTRALELLSILGVNPAEIERRIGETVRRGRGAPPQPDLPYTSRAKKIIELAMNIARWFGSNEVNGLHLFSGVVAEAKGIAAQVLEDCGVTLEVTLKTVAQLQGIPLPAQRWVAPDKPTPSAVARVEITSTNPTPRLDSLSRTTPASLRGQERLSVIADLTLVDTDVVVELMAALDALHRAWGGGGLVIDAQSLGVSAPERELV